MGRLCTESFGRWTRVSVQSVDAIDKGRASWPPSSSPRRAQHRHEAPIRPHARYAATVPATRMPNPPTKVAARTAGGVGCGVDRRHHAKPVRSAREVVGRAAHVVFVRSIRVDSRGTDPRRGSRAAPGLNCAVERRFAHRVHGLRPCGRPRPRVPLGCRAIRRCSPRGPPPGLPGCQSLREGPLWRPTPAEVR